MYHFQAPNGPAAPVSFLLNPQVVLVVDVFRALGDFEAHYDITALDRLEQRLSALVDPIAAKGIVSDALLLAFALRSERVGAWQMTPLGSRRASADEYSLLALVAGCHAGDAEIAARAALALGIRLSPTVTSLAREIGNRLEAAGIALAAPDRRLIPGSAPIPDEDIIEIYAERLPDPKRDRRYRD